MDGAAAMFARLTFRLFPAVLTEHGSHRPNYLRAAVVYDRRCCTATVNLLLCEVAFSEVSVADLNERSATSLLAVYTVS